MRVLKVWLFWCLGILVFTNCGALNKKDKSESQPSEVSKETEETEDPELAKAKQGESRTDTLHLIPNELGIGGMVTYTMYDNGLLVYDGYITYNFHPYWYYPYTESFSGRYRADSKTFMSETYKNIGDEHSDYKLVMEVVENNGDLNVVAVDVRENSAAGRFEIDVDDPLIDIHYAEVTGEIYGREVAIRVKK